MTMMSARSTAVRVTYSAARADHGTQSVTEAVRQVQPRPVPGPNMSLGEATRSRVPSSRFLSPTFMNLQLRLLPMAVRCTSAMLVALLLCASTAGNAWARDDHPRRPALMGGPRFDMRAQRQAERVQQRAAVRGAQQREQVPPPAALPNERPVEAPPTDRSGKPGRLSPDERRALRQQINDAGRDIYRPGRPP
jgi:hypothetical protein